MNADQKFLVVIWALFTLLIVFRVAPCVVLAMLAGLVWLAYVVVTRGNDR